MEENESGVHYLAQLLAKRKKLMDLRNTIISIDKCRTELNTVDLVANHHSNPVTPYSNEQRSISPPPFSPLTPLIAMKTTNKNISLSEGPSNSVFHSQIQRTLCLFHDVQPKRHLHHHFDRCPQKLKNFLTH
ncbi:uncharacterized protein LOC121738863 [Aricia agestis]|uniref:uncharacterized protein LOC121738863 n=1 Tax=Aricia agestis TaxID=91739 RepID=UPI001C206625|nr:uncharacterized protein LOC121738863 [Aricia agestis]